MNWLFGLSVACAVGAALAPVFVRILIGQPEYSPARSRRRVAIDAKR
jgi:hypothetical protein